MSIIGFSFSKFDCERKAPATGGNIEINHNIGVKNVEKTSLDVGLNKNDVLKVEFNFDIVYGNSLGKLSIEGDVIYADTPEIISEVFKGWEAEKKLNPQVNEQVFRFIYSKASIKALELSDALNLPSPIPLPKLDFSPKEN